jgi:excisionase family DNA binding protein
MKATTITVTLDAAELVELVADAVAKKLAPASAPADAYVTAARVAERLDCTAAHVRQLVATGKLPARRDGRRVLVRLADVEAYLAAPAKAGGPNVDELLTRRTAGGRK